MTNRPRAWYLLQLQILLWCLHHAVKIWLPKHGDAWNTGSGIHSWNETQTRTEIRHTAHEPWPPFKSNSLLWHAFKYWREKKLKLGWLRSLEHSKQLVYMTEHNTCCNSLRHSSHMVLTCWKMTPRLIEAALFPIKKSISNVHSYVQHITQCVLCRLVYKVTTLE